MADDKTITDAELQAYLDQQLDAQQSRDIERALQEDEHARETLKDYQQINQTLHQLYDPVLQEPVPPSMLATTTPSKIPSIAAAIALFLVGSVFGWQAPIYLSNTLSSVSKAEPDLVRPALFAHSIYAVEVAHPVEVNAQEHQHLNQWLSKRLKTTLKAPDLSVASYRLIGGRLLPSTQDRMAAQYMYENAAGNRITLYVRRGDWVNSQSINYQQQQGYAMFYWIDESMGYALTSDLSNPQHQHLAKEVYHQLSLGSIKI